MTWDALSQLMVQVASSIVGASSRNKLWTPYTVADKLHLDTLQRHVQDTFHALSRAALVQERIHRAQEHKAAKKQKQLFQRQCRKSWMQQVVCELDEVQMLAIEEILLASSQNGVTVAGTFGEGRADFSPEQLRQHALKVGGAAHS